MNNFEQTTTCGCNHPDCYFCNRRKMTPWIFAGLPPVEALLSVAKKKKKTPDEIFYAVCRLADADPELVKSKSRKLEAVIPRQVYCFVACMITDAGLKEIGKIIGRDRTTVIYSREKVRENIEAGVGDKYTMKVYQKVKGILSD